DVVLVNVALADRAGEADFFLDPTNCGNYSLVSSAMTGPSRSLRVTLVDAKSEARTWLASGRRLFYKSDTQGYDEVIANALDLSFWDQVAGAILEIWPIKKPAFDLDKFAAILDHFSHKAFLSNPRNLL